MYQCIKAIVRKKYSKGRWMEEDLKAAPVATLYATYNEVYLILSHPSLDHLVSLNMADVAVELSSLLDTVSVQDWLQALGNTALPTRNELPDITSHQARYNDVFQAGYSAKLVYAQGSVDQEMPDSEKDDILLTRPDTDYESFYNNCLVTVNGLIHRTDYDYQGIHVKDAGKSFRIANENHLGVISFKNIGELDFINITQDMVYTQEGGRLRDAAYIDLPTSMEGKVVMLVLGGYLHLLESYFYPTGDQTLKIDMANLPFLQRFYASKELIDLTSMLSLYEKTDRNPDLVGLDDLFSDASIMAFLTLSQSFIVLVDTDNLYVEKHKLEYTGLPGRYYSHVRPDWPIRTELGRLPEYVAIPESDIWVIAIQDNFSTKYRFETVPWLNESLVDSSRNSVQPVFYAQGHLLEIGSDIQGFVPQA